MVEFKAFDKLGVCGKEVYVCRPITTINNEQLKGLKGEIVLIDGAEFKCLGIGDTLPNREGGDLVDRFVDVMVCPAVKK